MSSGEPTTPTPPVNGSNLPPPGAPDGPAASTRSSTSSTPPPRPTPAAEPAPAGGSSDWPAQAADAIVEVVAKVRDATTGPVLTAARGLVYGTAILLLGATALVLLIAGAVRALDTFVPGEVWSAYLVLGVLFTAVGLILWTRRRPAGSG